MTDGKKIILFSVIAFLVFGSGFAGGYIIRQASDNKRISELEATNRKEVAARERAEKDAAGIRNAYTELDNTNKEIAGELEQSQTLNRKLISGIGDAQTATTEIIKGIDSIIEKVKQLGESE